MNNDLIRRSDLLAKKCMVRGHLDTGSQCPSKVVAIPVDVIERATAVDAVEVVRCKDCQNARRGGSGYVWCGDRTIPLNGFCSYGERKEERNDKK